MAFKQQKNGDIVISGFEKGIADSPELGFGDMRSVNITSVPGEASVSPSTEAGLVPPTGQTGVSFTESGNVLTVADTTGYYDGMAVNIDTLPLAPNAQVLVVGGGGGGGTWDNSGNTAGGGGGGGAVVFNSAVPLSIGTYTVVVGAGGSGILPSTGAAAGSNGSQSSFGDITADGGGGGGSSGGNVSQPNIDGKSGASGGGGAGNGDTSPSGAGGLGGAATNGHAGAAGLGNFSSTLAAGGGGGGAGTAGAQGTLGGAGGAGGNGASITIAGNITATYGGGGGGSSAGGSASAGPGGSGGGAAGSGANATANSGGGGGGSGRLLGTTSGNGGSGRVQIAYLTGSLTATGGTITTNGSYTVHTFTTVTTTSFVVTAVNPVVGGIYYVGNLSGNTFKLYQDVALTTLVTFVATSTGTLDVPALSTPVDKAYYQYYAGNTSPPLYATFLIDDTGNCWYMNNQAVTGTGGTVAAFSLQFAGNSGHATTGTGADFGIVAWNGYLFSIIGRTIGYIALSNLLGTPGANFWTNAWKTDLEYTQYQHQALNATDDAIYICNGQYVASIIENAGTVFDPATTSTYTYNKNALTLPIYDYAQSIAQLGTNLLIGGVLTFIYPWDRVSTSFNYPLVCADSSIKRIVSTNSNAYVFAGNRGRIYITNSQQIQVYKKIPDSLSGNPEPYYIWQDAIYLRNKLYFTMLAKNNASSTLQTMGGIWALGIDNGQTQIQLPTAGSLYNANQLSYGTYGGSCPVLFYVQTPTPAGYGVGAAWVDTEAVGTPSGIDIPSSTPYTGTQAYVDSDIIPVGTYYEAWTPKQFEYKLSKLLASGESVSLYYRTDLSTAFAQVPITESGSVSSAFKSNFQKAQWVQFRAYLASTATDPSYVRLTNLIMR